MSKIVLIGPVYPYKGGIAHYTSLLYRALAEKHDVTMLSFKLQYPKLLFKKEQKDYTDTMFKIENAQYLLNTVNPLNIIRMGKKIKQMNPDLVIMQWWHPYFAPCYWILETVLGKKTEKMFICHNVFPHERFPMDKFLTKLALKKGNSFIVHSASDGQDLLSIKPGARYRQNPHPTYNAFKIRNITKAQARKELGKSGEEKLLLFFGFVREYKGLKHLLNAMSGVKEKLKNIHLIVAGSFGGGKAQYIQLMKEKNITDCVEIIDSYIPADEVEKYFAACDLVVLPYESATQSGIVQIAYGFEKPVLVTNVGGLPDVVKDKKTGYVVSPRSPEQLEKAIIDFYEENRELDFCEKVREEAGRFSWDRMREAVEEAAFGKTGGVIRDNIFPMFPSARRESGAAA